MKKINLPAMTKQLGDSISTFDFELISIKIAELTEEKNELEKNLSGTCISLFFEK